MTLWFIMLDHHTKFGSKQLSGSDITQLNIGEKAIFSFFDLEYKNTPEFSHATLAYDDVPP